MQLHDTMMNPKIEDLLERVDSKFTLVTLASTRARQINDYYGQLGDGHGKAVPPQVTSRARKPLSIAFEEIAADKITPEYLDPEGAPLDADTDTDEGAEPTLQVIEGGSEA